MRYLLAENPVEPEYQMIDPKEFILSPREFRNYIQD
jgi:hypothetical protein